MTMAKKNVGKILTLVSRDYFGNGSVVKVASEGPKYLHGHSIYMDSERGRVDNSENGRDGWTPRRTWKYDKAKYLVVEGEHHELLSAIRKAKADQDEAVRLRDRQRDEAFWKFRREWDDANPFPRVPALEYLVRDILTKAEAA